MPEPNNESIAYFEVGAVAKITGLSANTLRTWERRGFIKASSRSDSGRRRFSQAQVEQLALMKKLTDLGDAISALANMSLESMRKRLLEYQTGNSISAHEERSDIKILTEGPNAGLWLSNLSSRFQLGTKSEAQYDLVVIDLSATEVECRRRVSVARIERPDTPIALIYDYAPNDLVKRFTEDGLFVIRWPCPNELLEHYLIAAIANATHQTLPVKSRHLPKLDESDGRIFTDKQLTLIASSNANMKCECPHHISALVASLASFENYCRRCEIESPKDAAVHSRLGKEIAKARSIVEQALLYLCEYDNISIPRDQE